MYLEAGTVLTRQSLEPSDDYTLHIEQQDGELYSEKLYSSGSRWTSYGGSILKSGTYTFRFVPENKSSVTLEFGFTNNNRKHLDDVSSGSSLPVSLNGWGQEYAKYRLSLNVGDLLEVTNPSDDDIWLYLINSDGRAVNSGSGEIYTRVSSGGDYYLFVVNKLGDSSSYYGSISVTPDPNVSSYPVLADISDQSATEGKFFSLQLSASNTPSEFSVSGLPTGISVDESSGLISGTPTISGTFPVKVRTENEFGSDRKDFFFTVHKELTDADGDSRLSLPDIIYGLQILTGLRNKK